MSKTRHVHVKHKCCKSTKRCTRCPILLKKLSKAGWAEQVEGRRREYVILPETPKSVVKALRKS